jgi:aryl-alcohol dehydrogenase-like predicted oxidoreductase
MEVLMETRQLGDSSLRITPIGFGAWAIGGGGWLFGWGPQDDNESIAAIRRALDEGINWIDTAAVYGLGHSEEVVARALKGRASRPYVFTKCGRIWNERREIGKSLKAESIRTECENSLRRLEVDVIDLYQMHWPEPDEQIEEGVEMLAKLKEEGKVRYIGVSNFNASQLKRALATTRITSLQPPYSMLRRDIEAEVLPLAARENIGVLAYSPMASGLLSGGMTRERIATLPEDDWRRRNPNYSEPLLSKNLTLVEKLRKIGARHGRTPGEVAIAWTLRDPRGQLDGVIGAADFRLAPDEVQEIESLVLQAV